MAPMRTITANRYFAAAAVRASIAIIRIPC